MRSAQGDTSWVTRRSWLPLLVFLIALAAYVPSISRNVVNTDIAANSLTAWHIAHTGKPWMDGLDLHEAGKVSHYGTGADGHAVTTRTPGQILAAVPFFIGSQDTQAGLGFFRSGLAASVMTAGAVALLFQALRGRLSDRAALGATAVVALTTPMWTVSANGLWTHPLTVLSLAGAALALRRERWWLVGIWLGVGMWGRLHIALIAAVVGLGLSWSRKSRWPAVGIAVPTIVALAGLSVWDHFVFGTWDPRGAYSGHTYASMVPGIRSGAIGQLQNVAGYLVSPDRGFFVWTPLALLLLPALARGWRSAPVWSRWLAVGGLVYSIAQLGLNGFGGGDGFHGYRLALEPLICVAPVYAFTASHAGRWARALAPWVIGLQAGMASLGAFFDATRYYVVEDDVWRDNSVLLILREQPALAGAMFLLFGVVAALLVRLSQRHLSSVASSPDVAAGASAEPAALA